MKGIVLGYDAAAEAVVVRADNGRRYRFLPAEWRDRASPRKGDAVDFEPDGDRARDVYLVGSAQHLETNAPAAPLAVVATWGPVRFFLARPVLTFSLLVLLACLTGAYAVGDVRISVLEVPELISRMSESLDSLIAVSGPDPAPRLGAAAARVELVLLLGLYVVPALALLVAWREFVGRSDARLARLAGIAAMVLPIALPLAVILVVQIWVLPGIPDVGARLGRSGVTTPQQVFEVLRLYATGTVLLLFAGAGLWAAASGRLSIPLDRRTIDVEPREAAQPKSHAEPGMFAPQRARPPGHRAAGEVSRTPPARPRAPEPAQTDAGGPIPFLKSGARRVAAAMSARPAPQPAPAAEPAPPAGDARAAFLAEAKPAPAEPKPADTAELPPRTGSVWPEPVPPPTRPDVDVDLRSARTGDSEPGDGNP